MLKAIPWETIGPIATAVIIILVVVFWFMLRWQKGTKSPIAPSNPPKDINATDKKSLCFVHEGRIASNETAIRIFSDSLKEANQQNSDQHGKIFDKMEEMGKEIVTEIHKANGGKNG